MSTGQRPNPPDAGTESPDESPNGSGSSPRQFESIVRDEDNDERDVTATGTVRRNRPPAMSVQSTSQNYGKGQVKL